MSETAKNKRQFFVPAFFVLPVGVLALFILPYGSFIRPTPFNEAVTINILSGMPALLGIILGIFCLVKIRRKHKVLKGFIFALAGLILSAFVFGIWFYGQITSDCSGLGRRSVGGRNLSLIYTAIITYNEEFDQYPSAENWCDLLMEHTDIKLDNFISPDLVLYWPVVGGEMLILPKAEKHNCGFALNPNAKPDSAEDMVLVFESKKGWNKNGGMELLNPDNHEEKGCNVLFNNGRVEFVETKDFNDLKWE